MFKNKVLTGILVVILVIFLGILGLRMVPDVQVGTSQNVVTIKSFAYSPNAMTIKMGTKVTWVNQDFVPHNVISDTFKSPVMMRGGTYEYTFNTKGVFEYICSIHPFMKAKIIVE